MTTVNAESLSPQRKEFTTEDTEESVDAAGLRSRPGCRDAVSLFWSEVLT
jgi:hypothetical protein